MALGEEPALERGGFRLAARAVGRQGDPPVGGDVDRGDHGVDDRLAFGRNLQRFGKAQRQRVAAVGQLRRGLRIGGVDRQTACDGLRKGDLEPRDGLGEAVLGKADLQHVHLVREVEAHGIAVVPLDEGLRRDGCGDHDVAGAVECAALHGRNLIRGVRPLDCRGAGRDGQVGVLAGLELRNVAAEAGVAERGVVVPQGEGQGGEGLGACAVERPQGDFVSVTPADRCAVVTECGARVGGDVEPGTGTDGHTKSACFGVHPGLRGLGARGGEQKQCEQGCPEFHICME